MRRLQSVINDLFVSPVLSRGSCSSGGFACRHLGIAEGRNRHGRPLKFDRSSESIYDAGSTLPVQSPTITPSARSQQPASAACHLPPSPQAHTHGSSGSLTCHSSNGADRPFEVGCDQRCSCREPPRREERGGGAGHGNANVANMKMDYIPHRKGSTLGTLRKCSVPKIDTKLFLNISEYFGAFSFFVHSNHLLFYTSRDLLGVHPFCYLSCWHFIHYQKIIILVTNPV